MITIAFTLLSIVLVAFTAAMLIIAIKEHREIKTATLKRTPAVRVSASDNLITAEEAA